MKKDLPIVVSRHAREQARQRLRLSELGDYLLDRLIQQRVQEALDSGRVRNHKLPSFRLYHERARQFDADQRFVWTADESAAWIIALAEDHVVVVTTLRRSAIEGERDAAA